MLSRTKLSSWYPRVRLDTDAQAFITAAGITNGTQKSAINSLVLGMKADGTWTKAIAVYPFVGGTAAAHKVNLKSPGTYDITWVGSPVQDANGFTAAVGAYGDTGFAPVLSSPFKFDDSHLGYYARTNGGSNSFDIGSADGVGSLAGYIAPFQDMTSRYYVGVAEYDITGLTPAQYNGLWMGSSTAGPISRSFFNGSQGGADSAVATPYSLTMPNFFVGNFNGVTSPGSVRNYAFATIGKGLTNAQVASYYANIQAFQTKLGRQV